MFKGIIACGVVESRTVDYLQGVPDTHLAAEIVEVAFGEISIAGAEDVVAVLQERKGIQLLSHLVEDEEAPRVQYLPT